MTRTIPPKEAYREAFLETYAQYVELRAMLAAVEQQKAKTYNLIIFAQTAFQYVYSTQSDDVGLRMLESENPELFCPRMAALIAQLRELCSAIGNEAAAMILGEQSGVHHKYKYEKLLQELELSL